MVSAGALTPAGFWMTLPTDDVPGPVTVSAWAIPPAVMMRATPSDAAARTRSA